MSLIRVDFPGRSVLIQDQGKRYTSEQRQDYSVSAISDDKNKPRSRESSRQTVQRPRSSSRREVRQRSDRDKKTDSRSSRESPLVITITVSPAAPLSPASIDDDDDDDHNDDDEDEDAAAEGDHNDGDDNDNSDNDSSPTLECPAQFPDLPQDTTVLHIPGKKSKRPGSSLEEKLEIRETSPKATGNSPKVPQSKKVKYDIVPEINKMSKEDQIDLDLEDSLYLDLEDNVVLDSEDEIDPDLEDEIAIDNSFDAHESLNGDDLLLTLEKMINN